MRGGAAGALSLGILYHADYARTRLATDIVCAKKTGNREFKGLIDVYRKTVLADGVYGLYRGFSMSCVGAVLYRGCYLGLFDSLKPIILTEKQDNTLASFALAWMVTGTAELVSYPADTVARRMMMTSAEAFLYRNPGHALYYIVKYNGVRSLYKGAGANIMRSFAAAMILAAEDTIFTRSGLRGKTEGHLLTKGESL